MFVRPVSSRSVCGRIQPNPARARINHTAFALTRLPAAMTTGESGSQASCLYRHSGSCGCSESQFHRGDQNAQRIGHESVYGRCAAGLLIPDKLNVPVHV